MKQLIKHQFIQRLAEIQLTKFSIKFVKRFFLPTQFFYLTILLPHNSFILGQEEKSQKKVYLLNLNWTNLILFIYVNGIRGKKGRGAPKSDIIEKHLFLDY